MDDRHDPTNDRDMTDDELRALLVGATEDPRPGLAAEVRAAVTATRSATTPDATRHDDPLPTPEVVVPLAPVADDAAHAHVRGHRWSRAIAALAAAAIVVAGVSMALRTEGPEVGTATPPPAGPTEAAVDLDDCLVGGSTPETDGDGCVLPVDEAAAAIGLEAPELGWVPDDLVGPESRAQRFAPTGSDLGFDRLELAWSSPSGDPADPATRFIALTARPLRPNQTVTAPLPPDATILESPSGQQVGWWADGGRFDATFVVDDVAHELQGSGLGEDEVQRLLDSLVPAERVA